MTQNIGNTNPNGPVIDVQRASIRTAQVTIKALTIDKRQVTQATYKQIPYEDLIARDYSLRGEPWGLVNYCVPKECGTGDDWVEHIHVLWQKGDELRRDFVRAPSEYVHEPHSAYKARWEHLRTLDQLFIAT